jgi:hypothetical protein
MCPTSLPGVPRMTHPRPEAGSVSFKPSQENSAHGCPVTNVEPTLDGSEDECTVVLALEHDVGGLDQVEIVVIPHLHLADAPATLEGLGHGGRAPHDTAPAMSLGSRTKL